MEEPVLMQLALYLFLSLSLSSKDVLGDSGVHINTHEKMSTCLFTFLLILHDRLHPAPSPKPDPTSTGKTLTFLTQYLLEARINFMDTI